MVNNKVYSAIKMSLFMANYKRELRMVANIRKKEKVEKVMKFTEKMKRVQKEAGAVLKRIQEEMKWQADRERREAEV